MALRRFRSAALWATLVLAVVSLAPRPAWGCSCMAPVDLGAMLDDAAAAFVGTMVDRRAGIDEFDAIYTFEVETWVKSDLGTAVDVHSGSNSAMCGFEQPTGDQVGLLVYNDGPRLSSGLCSMVSPNELIKVASGHTPRPGAIPPLVPEEVGLPGEGPTTEGSTTAQVALATLAAAAAAGFIVSRRRRSGSAPEK